MVVIDHTLYHYITKNIAIISLVLRMLIDKFYKQGIRTRNYESGLPFNLFSIFFFFSVIRFMTSIKLESLVSL